MKDQEYYELKYLLACQEIRIFAIEECFNQVNEAITDRMQTIYDEKYTEKQVYLGELRRLAGLT